MTPKERLHALVDQLSDVQAEDALDYLLTAFSEPETLTDEELAAVQEAEEDIARGEYITWTELRRSLAL